MKEILMHFDSYGNHLCHKHAIERAMAGEEVSMKLEMREDDYEIDCSDCSKEEYGWDSQVVQYLRERVDELESDLSESTRKNEYLTRRVEELETKLLQRDRLLKQEYEKNKELMKRVPKPPMRKRGSFLDITTPSGD